MEAYQDQLLDSPSKNSYIGSYYQPPDRLSPPSYVWEAPAPLTKTAMNLQNITPQVYRTTPDAGSKVIAALKTLQEKIRRLELERKQAEKNVKQFSQAAHGYECSITPCNTETDGSRKKERVTPLQSAEARCQLLEKQLDYMRKMVENAEKDKNTLTEKQLSLQKQRLQNCSDAHTPLEKLEKLERDCLKLSKTQSVAERKIELLEQKLLEEEHERKLVQEKADELQRELETNLRLCPAVSDEVKPKKKSKNASKKTSLVRQEAPAPPCFPKNKLPFVAGTSTSPSHSVHANMQSVLHMMKHHQPHLCERVRSLRRSGSAGARRALHRAPSTPTSPPGPAGPALGSLSELLLALQDELGQMSFEHQELVCQMDETRHRDTREDLERELELLVKRMEEKGSQITKLRKHQQTVDKLTQNPQKPRQRATSEDGRAKGGSGVRPLPPSPVKTTSRGGKRAGVSQEENLQLLRETQRLCTSLKKDDITWET
ncbi:centrosomal protein CEP57L1 isoform X2 [Salvelinus fontinalis]|uniref:centrosomal protein CEP57L1 isoform X2 n=1 Tax=Salvelinus fontinalis TaxID=8038 RepID=UPI002485E67F|nr:centrosomal protein CEP57L1 isoform X2 [Salvelinus fontinalis]